MNSVVTERRAPRSHVNPNRATPAAACADRPTLNPEFSVTRNGYHIRLVPDHGRLRDDVEHLIADRYASRGLRTDRPIESRGDIGEVALAACRGDRVFGTLTVRNDVGRGIFADARYRTEIDAVRARGAAVCEVGRLAMETAYGGQEALATLFQVGFIVARYAWARSDCFIEVHPRHAAFYSHMLGYRRVGPETTCPRVGAPAVLMHLPLDQAERFALLRGRACAADHAARNLYRQFLPPHLQNAIIADLLAGR